MMVKHIAFVFNSCLKEISIFYVFHYAKLSNFSIFDSVFKENFLT